eukprot:TRINITY_DN843_c0_g1_i2.p2 TRINITY_DN843_c0_g1~~TRINITY_DN843_c0_g1_i2.p2  ORF type:complete len:253 (-),score=-34.51 TRINITY_DN843_c0_g1_i2:397-1155(-)
MEVSYRTSLSRLWSDDEEIQEATIRPFSPPLSAPSTGQRRSPGPIIWGPATTLGTLTGSARACCRIDWIIDGAGAGCAAPSPPAPAPPKNPVLPLAVRCAKGRSTYGFRSNARRPDVDEEEEEEPKGAGGMPVNSWTIARKLVVSVVKTVVGARREARERFLPTRSVGASLDAEDGGPCPGGCGTGGLPTAAAAAATESKNVLLLWCCLAFGSAAVEGPAKHDEIAFVLVFVCGLGIPMRIPAALPPPPEHA